MISPILHIQHASNLIPFTEGYLGPRSILDQEILKLTDWYTDDLFSLAGSKAAKADFSRIFCDVERFADDEQKVMAQKGMGVLYENADSGIKIREVSETLRSKVLDNYYWPHHSRLNLTVNEQLQSHGKAAYSGRSDPPVPI